MKDQKIQKIKKPVSENVRKSSEISKLKQEIFHWKSYSEKYKKSHQKMLEFADKQNFLLRSQKHIDEKIKYANFEFAKTVLGPVEWLEQTLIHSPKDSQNTWLKGLEHILNKFRESLNSFGVKEIKINIGDKVDPHTAEIVDFVNDDKIEHNHIVKITQKGYYMHDRVLQHAKVIVSK